MYRESLHFKLLDTPESFRDLIVKLSHYYSKSLEETAKKP